MGKARMTQQHDRPQDTREFLAQWNAATEAHLTDRLTEVLERLAKTEKHMRGDGAAVTVLAPHVLHALQVAATPGATVHDAIDFLAALAEGPPDSDGAA
jgi:hypothetical protein